MALIVKSFIQSSQRESSVDPPFWVKPKNLIKSWWNSVFGKSPYRETIIILSHQVPTTSWYSCLNSQWAPEYSADKESCVDNATRYHKESCAEICASSVDPLAQTTVKNSSKKSCPVKTQKNVNAEGKQLKPGTTTSTVTVQPTSTVLNGCKKHQKVVDYSAASGPSKRRRRTKCKKVAKPVCIVSVPKKGVRDKREIGSGHVARRH